MTEIEVIEVSEDDLRAQRAAILAKHPMADPSVFVPNADNYDCHCCLPARAEAAGFSNIDWGGLDEIATFLGEEKPWSFALEPEETP